MSCRRRGNRIVLRTGVAVVMTAAAMAIAGVPAANAVPLTFVKGTVTAADTGAPLADVSVSVFDASSDDPSPIKEATTDSTGQYSLRLQRGAYRFEFWPQAPYIGASEDVVTGSALRQQVDGTVPLGATVAGTITDAFTGQPIEGVCVTANIPACTDAQGHYESTGLPASSSYRIIANLLSKDPDYDEDFRDVVTVAGQTTQVDFVLQPRASALVTVLGADGQPVEGASVVRGPNANFGGPTTDANGQMLVRGLFPSSDGTALISVTPQLDNPNAGTAVRIPVQRGQTTAYTVTLPLWGHLLVSFNHPDGNKYLDDCMILRPAAEDQYDGSSGNCTDATDTMPFDLAPGTYTYTVNLNQQERDEPETLTGTVDVAAGSNTLTIDVPHLVLGTVTGLVTDAATGAPLPGTSVTSSDGATTMTGADGRYTLTEVGRDGNDVTLTANTPEAGLVHSWVTKDVTVVPGGTVTVDFALPLNTSTP